MAGIQRIQGYREYRDTENAGIQRDRETEHTGIRRIKGYGKYRDTENTRIQRIQGYREYRDTGIK